MDNIVLISIHDETPYRVIEKYSEPTLRYTSLPTAPYFTEGLEEKKWRED